MSENTDQKDKIFVDPSNRTDVSEMFSRMQPGDEVSGKFKCTLDEAGSRVITLSIVDLEFDEPEASGPAVGVEDEDKESDEDSAAVRVMKNEDGVPDNEDNMPSDLSPTS